METQESAIQDQTIFDLRILNGPCYPYLENNTAIIVGKRARIEGWIKLPKRHQEAQVLRAQSPSTNARVGLNETLGEKGLRSPTDPHFPETMRIIIENYGEYNVLINDKIRVVIADLTAIFKQDINSADSWPKMPRANSISLHAGDTKLKIIEEKLDTVWSNRIGHIRYIDPNAKNLSYYTREVPFHSTRTGQYEDMFPGDFLVFPAQERVIIPHGKIGIVHSAHNGLTHTSAKFIYAGVDAAVTLEFRAVSRVSIYPGMRVATITLHDFNGNSDYRSRYDRSKSTIPRARE
ncbi:MAG: hypothetical protein G01um101433_255 [Parcubacteria group bacterium Gr01-1014_33]|nr:MAG: hypothetical protein G01um101433_255 [Parcubacteria group bacterium Gr01-1014_33]